VPRLANHDRRSAISQAAGHSRDFGAYSAQALGCECPEQGLPLAGPHRGRRDLSFRPLTSIGFVAVIATIAGSAHAQTIDNLEGLIVREIRVTGVKTLAAGFVERHLSTRVGQPFHSSSLQIDRRRLDELRLFTSVSLTPRLDSGAVILDVAVDETLRALPIVVLRVTDENGLSIGPGLKGLNFFGRGAQLSASVRFGGETAASFSMDTTTITPGTGAWHFGFSDTHRQNTLYGFEEHATSVDMRMARNWARGLRGGLFAEFMTLDTGASGASLSPDGRDVIPTIGMFAGIDQLDSSTDPRAGTWAELQIDRLFGDAGSWTITMDGRRFQPLNERNGLGVFGLMSLQTGEVGAGLPEYMQYALGGGNTVRGWELGSRRGRNQFISSAEYTFVMHPVSPFSVAGFNLYAGIQAAAFADLGLAWNDAADFEASSAIDGYGFGVRLLVPFVDVIRIDVAWGEPGHGASAYFGVSLKATRQRQRVR
jgi:outer membrane protein assembly factor BamA